MFNLKNTYRKKSDSELVLLYQKKQDQRIVLEFYQRYQYAIKSVCWKYLKNDDCKDVSSELLEKLMMQFRKEIPQNIGAWVYTVSRNTCLIKLRKENKIQKVELNDFEISHLSTEVSSKEKEALLLCLEKAILNLKVSQKDCIKSFYLKEMSYAEIAKQSDQSIKKIKSCLQNGRRNIKLFIDKNLETL